MYRDPYDDTAQPICPACGVTMHPLLDEGVGADECRACGFRVEWPDPETSGHVRTGDRWVDEGWG